MNNIKCLYPDRDAVLVAYLYDDIDAAQRVAFETHVAMCEPCRTELADLRGVRETLGQWASPEPARSFTASSHPSPPTSLQSPVASHPSAAEAWWHTVPVWAQVAAATGADATCVAVDDDDQPVLTLSPAA